MMAMIPRKSSILRIPRICYEGIRMVRGRVTIKVKLVKPAIPVRKRTLNHENSMKIARANVGIGHTLATYMNNPKAKFDDIDEDYLMDMDKSFEELGDIIETTERTERKKIELNSILAEKRKYLKDEKLPNMLTYIEKQQMKYLNEKDPDVWSPEKLAESFPATPEIVKKILNSRFTAHSVEQALKHDTSVKKNWQLFKCGKLQLSDELRQVYEKFIDRQIIDPDINEIKKLIPPPPDFASQIPVQEFGSIISSTKRFQQKQEQLKLQREEEEGRPIFETSSDNLKAIDEDHYILPRQKHNTLKHFRDKIDPFRESNTSELDRLILSEKPLEELPMSEENNNEKLVPLSDCTSHTGVVSHHYNPVSPVTLDRYPLRIHIPHRLRKKGKLYKVLDRFYSSDGNFMFRIPGLVD